MTEFGEAQALRRDLERLARAKNDDFLKLVSLAKLDPATDFIGADLRGTNLEGLDLRRFDFRDADFRGANIRGTKFDPKRTAGAKFDKVDATKGEAENKPFQSLDRLSPLRNHPLFREFPATVIEHFGTYMTRRSVRRGATIFAKGDPGTGLMAVLWGSVKISVPTADGREAVLNIINSGEIFGEIALLDGRPRTADAVAVDDCELMVIDRRDFIPFLREQPDIALKFIEILCARLRHTSEQVEDLMFLSFPGRLAKTLLQLIGGPEAPVTHRNVRVTQRELAGMVGATRGSIQRQLHVWQRRKWIRLDRNVVVVLAPSALMRVADGEL